MLHALDTDEDLVHVPLVDRSWPAAAHAVGKTASRRLVRGGSTAFRQDQLNIAQAKAEHVGQPESVADDLGREPMMVDGSGGRMGSCRQSRPPHACCEP